MSTSQYNWDSYIEATKQYKPSALLIKALEYTSQPGYALELGGGALNDTKFLLSQGWEVMLVDSAPAVGQLTKDFGDKNLHCTLSSFEDYTFPKERYALINAMYSLSFSPPHSFMKMMHDIKVSLLSGGVFCGNIFGEKDDWVHNPAMTFLKRDVVEDIFSDMEVLFFEEIERDNILSNGKPKHWHEYRVIARSFC